MVKSGLLNAVLTQHSTSLAPLDVAALASPDGTPLANMDHYRMCTLVDKSPRTGGHTTKVFHRWAVPSDGDAFDGSILVMLKRLLPWLERLLSGL